MASSDQIIVINQLASRLENATSTERIYALQELQSHARNAPELVGSLSLKPLLDFLQEQGSAEEYQEALDLMYRLVKSRDKVAARTNTDIILADVNAVELFLDLLNHEDLTVGVMTSQILTEIHAHNGATLEMQIQQCPDGMNKLLQRLPDSSREEVRNQAIVLIQQLTLSNEEMKKTVVFNEGFEILFGIIQNEGGVQDSGLVVQDCLQICNNILSDSETCQRLFFAMGSDWILRLVDFFDPLIVEALGNSNAMGGDDPFGDMNDGDDMQQGQDGDVAASGSNNAPVSECWFDDTARMSCAVLALSSLFSALSAPNPKHQLMLATSTSVTLPSAAFWIARRGPADLVNASLSLLARLVQCPAAPPPSSSSSSSSSKTNNNDAQEAESEQETQMVVDPMMQLYQQQLRQVSDVGTMLANCVLKVGPAVVRKNFPASGGASGKGLEAPALLFGWRPLPTDDRRCISVLALLAESYIYPNEAWDPSERPDFGDYLQLTFNVTAAGADSTPSSNNDGDHGSNNNNSNNSGGVVETRLSQGCLQVLEKIFSADSTISDLLIQHVLAPPPPDIDPSSMMMMDMDASSTSKNGKLESMQPLGLLVMQLLIQGCDLVLEAASYGTGQLLANHKIQQLRTAERAANFLAVTFVHGSQLAKELCTAITMAHTGAAGDSSTSSGGGGGGGGGGSNKCLLPTLLFAAGRTARMTGGVGYPFLVSILRLLATIASGCELAAKQMLEDPANLFVVDLATSASESAGVPPLVQGAACMFLGCCFKALPVASSGDSSSSGDATSSSSSSSSSSAAGGDETSSSLLTHIAFLRMIEARIGLSRFTDILRKPLTASRLMNKTNAQSFSPMFISPDFYTFYQTQVEAIRAGIFEFYTGGGGGSGTAGALGGGLGNGSAGAGAGDALQLQIIQMQKDKIAELEAVVQGYTQLQQQQGGGGGGGLLSVGGGDSSANSATAAAAAAAESSEKVAELTEQLREKEVELAAVKHSEVSLQAEAATLQVKVRTLEQEQVQWQQESRSREELSASASTTAAAAAAAAEAAEAEYRVKLQAYQQDMQQMQERLAVAEKEASSLQEQVEQALDRAVRAEEQVLTLENQLVEVTHVTAEKAEAEILLLKEKSVQEYEEKKQLKEALEQRDRKIELLESELSVQGATTAGNAELVSELESRNAELKQQLWAAEAELEKSAQQQRQLAEELAVAVAAADAAASAAVLAADTSATQENDVSMLSSSTTPGKASGEQSTIVTEAAAQSLSTLVDEVLSFTHRFFITQGITDFDEITRTLQEELVIDSESVVATLSDSIRILKSLNLKVPLLGTLLHSVGDLMSVAAGECSDMAEGAGIYDLAGEEGSLSRMLDCCHKLRANLYEATQREEEADVLQSQVEDLSQQLEDAEKARTYLEEEMQRLEEQVRLATVSSNAAATIAIAQQTAKEEEEKEKDEEEKQKTATAVAAAVAAVEAEGKAQLEREVAAAREEVIAAEAAKQQQLVVEHEEKLTQLTSELKQTEERLVAAVQERADLLLDMDVLKQSGSQSTEEIRAQLESMRHALSESEHRVDALGAELGDVTSQKELAEAIAAQAESEGESWKEQAAAASQQVAGLRQAAQQVIQEVQQRLDAAQLCQRIWIAEAGDVRALLVETERCNGQLVALHGLEVAQLQQEKADMLATIEEMHAKLLASERDQKEELLALQQTVVSQNQQVEEAAVALEDLKEEHDLEWDVQDRKYADLLVTVEELTDKSNRLEEELASEKALVASRSSQITDLTTKCEQVENELEEAQAAASRLRDALTAANRVNGGDSEALRSQGEELLRLTQTVDHLAKEARLKDESIASLTTQLCRREGESAGVMATLEDVKRDIDELRGENERLSDRLMAESKLVKEKEKQLRELQSALQDEQLALRDAHTQLDTLKELVQERKEEEDKNNSILEIAESRLVEETAAPVDNTAVVSALKDLIIWLTNTFHIVDYAVVHKHDPYSSSSRNDHDDSSMVVVVALKAGAAGSGSEGGTPISEPVSLIDVVSTCVKWVLATQRAELSEQAALMSKKEQELSSLKRIILALESSADSVHAEKVLHTPVRVSGSAGSIGAGGSGSGSNGTAGTGSNTATSTADDSLVLHDGPDSLKFALTPVGKAAKAQAQKDDGLGPQQLPPHSIVPTSAVKWSGAKTLLMAQATPAAKQAARMHSELLKERSKLMALQEQHADLLSLLAQQDVELSVFRDAIQNSAGQEALSGAEEEAKQHTIELYGTYTQFRYDL